jgi:hypothetical protein
LTIGQVEHLPQHVDPAAGNLEVTTADRPLKRPRRSLPTVDERPGRRLALGKLGRS